MSSQSEQPDMDKAIQEGMMNFQFEGMTELSAMVAQTKEIFDTHVAAGFSDSQALYVTAAIFTANPGIAPDH